MKSKENIPEILHKLKSSGEDILWVYSVPEAYFETLEERLRQRINFHGATESDPGPAVTDQTGGIAGGYSTPFSVPSNYFENLEGRLLGKVTHRTSGKIFTYRRIYRIVAAAVITGLLIAAGNLFFNASDSKPPATTYEESQLHQIKSEELLNFSGDTQSGSAQLTASQSVEPSRLLKEISSSDLQIFLEETGTESPEIKSNVHEVN